MAYVRTTGCTRIACKSMQIISLSLFNFLQMGILILSEFALLERCARDFFEFAKLPPLSCCKVHCLSDGGIYAKVMSHPLFPGENKKFTTPQSNNVHNFMQKSELLS